MEHEEHLINATMIKISQDQDMRGQLSGGEWEEGTRMTAIAARGGSGGGRRWVLYLTDPLIKCAAL